MYVKVNKYFLLISGKEILLTYCLDIYLLSYKFFSTQHMQDTGKLCLYMFFLKKTVINGSRMRSRTLSHTHIVK